MTDKAITIDKTTYIKAIAILLMMWHHLFGCGYLVLKENTWFSFFPKIVSATGEAAKICIFMFLFCSGYGLYKSYVVKRNTGKYYIFQRMIKTLIPYWIIMTVAIIYLLITGRYEVKYLFINLFALLHNDGVLYISFSWFIKLYLCLLLLMPIIKLIESKWEKNLFLDCIVYILIPFLIAFVLKGFNSEDSFINIGVFVLSTIGFTCTWMPLFSVGLLFAKYNIYERLFSLTENINRIILISVGIVIGSVVLFARYKISYGCKTDIIYGPIYIVAILIVYDSLRWKSKYLIPFLGKHSMQYWLISGMFFLNTEELQFLLYWPKWTLVVFIWTMLFLAPMAFLCNWVSKQLLNLRRVRGK